MPTHKPFPLAVRRSAFCLLLALAANTSFAEDPKEINLQRKLDAGLDLTLEKIPLQEAFAAIARQAGISIQVDQAAYDAIPYGSTTAVTATFRATPTRDAIDAILSHLALEKVIVGSAVLVRPSAPLAHLGRRAEWAELRLIEKLNDTRVEQLSGDWAKDLRLLLGDATIVMDITGYDQSIHDKAIEQVKSQLPTTLFAAITLYASASDKIWWVEKGNIVLMGQRDWIRRQLSRPIVLSFTNRPLQEVVETLGRLSGIRFAPDPGLYTAFPAVSLNSTNGTVQQTLDALSGATGIAYDIQADAIALRTAGKVAPPAPADAIVGRLAVPIGATGTTFDIFLRESDLTPELNTLRKKKLATSLEKLQHELSEPPATTTTAPATQP